MVGERNDAGSRARRAWRWAGGAVLALGLLVALAYLRPMAPRQITLLTGPEGSTYHAQGLRYAAALEQHGLSTNVVVTNGALDNLQRLIASEGPVIAFAQSGVERELGDTPGLDKLASLGSIAYEPLWMFVREDTQTRTVADLAGRPIALGPQGSGSRAIAMLLLEANGIAATIDTASFDNLGNKEASEALLSGTVDAVFIVGGIRSPEIQELDATEGIRPLPFERATTYAALIPAVASFEVPPGAFDLRNNRPPRTVPLVAATTNLVARKKLHAAVVNVVLKTARTVHARPTLEAPTGRFPAMSNVSLPPNPVAERFYADGPTAASRLLPYWLSAIVDQVVFVVVPAFAILFALLKTVPLVLAARFSLRSVRICRRLVAAEKQVLAGGDAAQFQAAIDAADEYSATMHVPPSKAAEYLELRQNLHDARERYSVFEAARHSQ